MAVHLDLADIQGNILTAYGKLSFPRGRVILLNFDPGPPGSAPQVDGRGFVTDLLPMVTTALRWRSVKRPGHVEHMPRPSCTVNIGFTWYGLLALGVPTRTLRAMPDEFIDGMARRASMLGDNFKDANKSGFAFLDSWDRVWRNAGELGPKAGRVHAFVLLNADMAGADGDPLDGPTQAIRALIEKHNVKLLTGHDPNEDVPYQELSALLTPGHPPQPSPKEHFGYTDAIGDPVFDGQDPLKQEKEAVFGNGALQPDGTWRPIATGEFLLGYPDEAQEIAGAPMPLDFSRNGTFVAYRKLHQNVASFRSYMENAAAQYSAFRDPIDPEEPKELLLAKIAGRWSDGVPLSVAPTYDAWKEFTVTYPQVDPSTDLAGYLRRDHALRTFTYGDDPKGVKCPITSHMRRVNTRDDLAPTHTEGSVLNNRRRILRRGLPYGASPEGTSDADDHGIVMLVTCASLFRQFEFVQQQWINYGLDASAGNDACPLVGNHGHRDDRNNPGTFVADAKFVVPADPKSGLPPFVLDKLPQFVETRGGDYFFIPSMTALRMIGMGVVDPT